MRTTSLALSALLSTASLVHGECAADNCLRALRATQTPGRLEAARSFCATYTAAAATAAPAIPTYALNACKANQHGEQSVRLSSACSCIAPVTTTATPTATQTASPTGACALVSSSWAAQAKATPTPLVSAELAYECLNSVPLGKDAAIELVDALVPYLEWQSDSAYKANPPKDYPYPGFDLFANLAKVRANLVADKYTSEAKFQWDLYETVFGPGHDGHYVFYPDALAKVFEFRRTKRLVSISEDGSSLPVIKLLDDVTSSPETASAITQINGIEAAKYLQDTIDRAGWSQDKDANYNSMFFSLANGPGFFAQGGRIRLLYQGANTTFTFANGTSVTYENKAGIRADLTGVTSGTAFYSKFCTPANTTTTVAAAEVASDAILPGYPEPIIATSDGVVSGYYLDGPGLEDVAVIVLTAFESESIPEFQAVTEEFFANATAAGKTKLVIDFQANGGGYILLGYDFFRQLFPSIDQEGDSRWKENDGFMAISEIRSAAVEGLNPYTSPDSKLIDYYESWFNWRTDLNDTNGHFTSFEDKFAPHVYENTKYTNRMRWDLYDNLTTTNSTFGMGIEISGYGTRANLTQPFKAENIVMLYDGVCASTCTLASEFLRVKAGVKSIAFGGRPTTGPIQGVGGVKGAQVLDHSNIYSYAQDALTRATTDEQRTALNRYTDLPLKRSTAAAVNVRDQILPGNVNDGIPAQFVVEEADCRLYWTAPMLKDSTAIWKAAANAAFNGAKCVAGGIARTTPARHLPAPRVGAHGVGKTSMSAERRAELASRKAPTSAEWEAMYRQVATP